MRQENHPSWVVILGSVAKFLLSIAKNCLLIVKTVSLGGAGNRVREAAVSSRRTPDEAWGNERTGEEWAAGSRPSKSSLHFSGECSAREIFDGTATLEPDLSVTDVPEIRQPPAQDPDALPVNAKHRFPVPGTGK